MSRAGLLGLAGLAAACVAGLVLVLALGPDGRSAAPPQPLAVATSIAPDPVFFGDLVTARAAVTVDPRRADPDSVRLDPDFAPYSLVGAPDVSRRESDRVSLLTYRYTLSCLTASCLPGRNPGGIALPQLRVRGELRGGGTAQASARWPRVGVTPRVPAAAVADTPAWRLELDPGAVSYRTRPDLLVAVLIAAAVALALGALALVGRELVRRRRLIVERARRRSALARALELVRESAARGPDDRRRALGLLARILARDANGGRPLAPAVARLAWAQADPSPAGLEALVAEVERTVESA